MRRTHLSAAAALLMTAAAPALASSPFFIEGYYGPDRRPDGNSLIYDVRGGLLVVDTGRHEAHWQQILAYARGRGRPVRWIVNTHWHLDHNGGNAAIRAAFPAAKIYAGSGTALALKTALNGYDREIETSLADPSVPEARKRELRPDLAAVRRPQDLLPDVTVEQAMTLPTARGPLELRIARHAATATDLWLLDRKHREVATGDLVTLPAPFFDSGCARGWRLALDQLWESGARTFYPGHGAPMTRADFAVYRRAFDRLVDCVEGNAPAETCVEGWVADARPLLKGPATEQARDLLTGYMRFDLRASGRQEHVCNLRA